MVTRKKTSERKINFFSITPVNNKYSKSKNNIPMFGLSSKPLKQPKYKSSYNTPISIGYPASRPSIKSHKYSPLASSISIPKKPQVGMFFPIAKRPASRFYGDADRDGVMNGFDCAPYDRRRQGILSSAKASISKAVSTISSNIQKAVTPTITAVKSYITPKAPAQTSVSQTNSSTPTTRTSGADMAAAINKGASEGSRQIMDSSSGNSNAQIDLNNMSSGARNAALLNLVASGSSLTPAQQQAAGIVMTPSGRVLTTDENAANMAKPSGGFFSLTGNVVAGDTPSTRSSGLKQETVTNIPRQTMTMDTSKDYSSSKTSSLTGSSGSLTGGLGGVSPPSTHTHKETSPVYYSEPISLPTKQQYIAPVMSSAQGGYAYDNDTGIYTFVQGGQAIGDRDLRVKQMEYMKQQKLELLRERFSNRPTFY